VPDVPQRVKYADQGKNQHEGNGPYYRKPQWGNFQESGHQQRQAHPDNTATNGQDQCLDQEQPNGLPQSPTKHTEKRKVPAL
jgi:hypothetical protein